MTSRFQIPNIPRLYRDAYAGLPRIAWRLALVILINRSGSMVLFFMTLYLTRRLDFSVILAGQMISLYGFGSIIGNWLGGWFSDRWGTGRVMWLSLLFSGIGFLTLMVCKTPAAFGPVLFTLAVVSEAFRPANAAAMAGAVEPSMRARAFALQRLAVNLGVAIGPALGGFLARRDYGYLFWVDGLTCLAAALLSWRYFRDSARPDQFDPPAPKNKAESPLRDPVLVRVLGLFFLMGILFFQLFNTWPLTLREQYLLTEDRIGLLLTLNAAMIVFIEMPLIHRLEKKDPLRIIRVGALLLFSGFVLLPLGGTFPFAALTVVVWTSGEILVFPLIMAVVSNRADDVNRGRVMGLFTLVFSLSFIAGPALGTRVYDTWGSSTLWFGFAGVGFLVWLGFTRLQRLYDQTGGQT